MTQDSPVDALRPSEMGRAGTAVWEALTSPCMPPVDLALAAEAARIADRLDRFDRMLHGEDQEWLRLVPERGNEAVLIMRPEGIIQEARQQAVVLKQIRAELARGQQRDSDDREDDDLAGL